MSNRTKEEQLRAALPPGMLPKSERRKLGKVAKAKRIAAQRRKKILNNAAVVGVVLVVVAVILTIFGVFGGSSSPSASPSASASGATPDASATGFTTPAGADPSLEQKPVVSAGTGDVTKLVVTTLIQGTGAAVTSGQTITVNYVGVDYKTGVEFDSSWKRNTSATFPIGTGNVIKGWDQGLVGVKIGSRVQLDIPADLAYGETSTSGSPAGDLRFVVDILGAN